MYRTSACAFLLALLSVSLLGQAPVAAPFTENFDAETICGASTTAACPLAGAFQQDTTDAGDWIVDNGGTSSFNTGPSIDHTTGTATGNYLYTETSGALVGSERRLLSPLLDLTTVANPIVAFWYHMWGGQMGTLHVDGLQQLNVGSDGIAVPGGTGTGTLSSATAIFTAGQVGDTVTIEGAAANAGTYTISSIVDAFTVTVTPDFLVAESALSYRHERLQLDVLPSRTDNLDQWQRWSVPLSTFLAPPGNNFTTRVIIRGVAGTSFESDMAIDDFNFFDGLADDVRVSSITSPSAQLCVGSYAVSALIENLGTNAQTNLPLSLLLNGAVQVTDVVPTVAAGASFVHTFSAPAVFAPGVTTLDVLSGLATDMDPTNDLQSLMVNAVPVVTTYPYFEDFENGMAGWSINGTSTSWAFGTPANGVINGAGSGLNAFAVGNLTGNYGPNENGFIKSPCFDLSGLTTPVISLKVWWNCDFSNDGANLQASTDGGITWSDVGTAGDPDNWFNDGTIGANPGGSQAGWTGRDLTFNGSGGYLTAIRDLSAFAGATNIEFRVNFASNVSIEAEGFAFDDVRVAEAGALFPGSGEDLELAHGVNAAPDDAPGGDIKPINPGSFATLLISSPGGTYVGAPYALVADSYSSSGGLPIPISPTFPEAHISNSAVVVLDGNNSAQGGGFSFGVASGGSELNLAVLDPGLVGTSVMLQALVLDSTAANGFFAITDAKVFEIQ